MCTSAAEPAPDPDTGPAHSPLERLLAVTQVRELMESMQAPIEQNIRATAARAMQGKQLTAAQQQEVDAAMGRASGVLRAELTFDKLKPMYLQIYRESLDQAEVDGMIAFYQTPAGQAVIKKMPLVDQKMMAAMQEFLGTLMPRVDAAMKQGAALGAKP